MFEGLLRRVGWIGVWAAALLTAGCVSTGATPKPGGPSARQFRVARPTDKLEEVVRFYHEGLGLPVLGSFSGHAGYDGVMLGLPDSEHHLEFTRHVDGSPGSAPTDDNLLVFYYEDRAELEAVRARLAAMGHVPVAPENPYWIDKSITIPDPDGWRVVLFAGRWTPWIEPERHGRGTSKMSFSTRAREDVRGRHRSDPGGPRP